MTAPASPPLLPGLLLLLGVLLPAPARAGQPAKLPDDPVRGRDRYEDLCWSCHGPAGQGDGPLAPALAAPLRSLRGLPEETWDALVDLVQEGKGDMPAYAEVMDRPDSRRILVWLAALDAADPDPDLAPRRVDDPAATPGRRSDETRPEGGRPNEQIEGGEGPEEEGG